MPFVLAASIAACWAFQDEDDPVADLALERILTDEARVPDPWWFEIGRWPHLEAWSQRLESLPGFALPYDLIPKKDAAFAGA